jgi:hypothetical protein
MPIFDGEVPWLQRSSRQTRVDIITYGFVAKFCLMSSVVSRK